MFSVCKAGEWVFKIGDFSQMGQVSVRMLRHYDKLDLLKPGHVDEWTGYRYYTIDQLPRLHRILALRDLGLSLQQIGDLLADKDLSPEQLQAMLRARQQEIEAELREERARLLRINARLRQLERENQPPSYDVALKEVPAQTLFAVRRVVPHLDDMPTYRDQMLIALYNWLAQQRVEYGEELAVYHLSAYAEEEIDMSLGVRMPAQEGRKTTAVSLPSHAEIQRLLLPAAPLAASVIHHGSVWDIPDVVSELYRWLGTNGYMSVGPFREIHRFGRERDVFAAGTQDDVVFEILVPIERL